MEMLVGLVLILAYTAPTHQKRLLRRSPGWHMWQCSTYLSKGSCGSCALSMVELWEMSGRRDWCANQFSQLAHVSRSSEVLRSLIGYLWAQNNIPWLKMWRREVKKEVAVEDPPLIEDVEERGEERGSSWRPTFVWRCGGERWRKR